MSTLAAEILTVLATALRAGTVLPAGRSWAKDGGPCTEQNRYRFGYRHGFDGDAPRRSYTGCDRLEREDWQRGFEDGRQARMVFDKLWKHVFGETM